MGKPGLGLFAGRRKSQSNALEEVDATPSPDAAVAPSTDSGGFRLMSRTEVEKANERRKVQEKEKPSKFPRFGSFGTSTSKARNQSFDEESPTSSKRDSKSSSGTQFSSSRPYANGQHGSTSTLPSSTDASSDDNIFAGVPRPHIAQHNSSLNYPVNGVRKQLPSLPKTSSGTITHDAHAYEPSSRNRALTASSYASTAIAPKLDADLNFGDSSFDDMFGGMARKESPDSPREVAGRSLLSDKRTFHAEPIKINPKLNIEPPLKSWDSRGSTENLMSPQRSDSDSPPPPPPHRSAYAPIASESPTISSPANFHDVDEHHMRKSFMARPSYRETSPGPQSLSVSSSSATSYDTPLSSRSTSNKTNNTTPKAALAPVASPYSDTTEDDLFTTAQTALKFEQQAQQSTVPTVTKNKSASAAASSGSSGRVMTQAEFHELQKRQMSKPPVDDSSDEEDYEDEEDAIKKREEEEIMRRKNQQMSLAREALRRSTTAPTNPSRPESAMDSLSMGFPSETSMKADEWEDENIPLGILAQHGFPSQTRNRAPTQPANAMPSYFQDRPASAGAMSNRTSQAHLPAFARNLPVDPYIGGGLVKPTNRESMGFNSFNRGPASIAGDSIAGGMNMGMGMGMSSPMMYQDAGMSQPSLVDQIQMRDMTKQKYMGGASNKKPAGGPFTGMLGHQMNAAGQAQNPTRMPQMPMNGMNPMMMGNQMPMLGMGLNQMGFPMGQQDQYMQMQQFQHMQQMLAVQQMQLQQFQAMQQQQGQDPRMPMAMPNMGLGANMMGNGSFLSVPGSSNGMPNQQHRPMSFMSGNGNMQQQQHRPMSTFMGPGPGYTPSIAPSERSNIGLSARYRPVVNHSDSMSNGTSMTLQASGGANQSKPGVIKGILKKASPQPNLTEEDEDWSKMAARKKRFAGGKENSKNGSDLEELTRGLNI